MEEGEEEENETNKGERGFGDRVPETSMELIHFFFYISTSFISTPSLRYWENLSTLLSTLQAEISDSKKKLNFFKITNF